MDPHTLLFHSNRVGLHAKSLNSVDNTTAVLADSPYDPFFHSLGCDPKHTNGFRYSEDGSMVVLFVQSRMIICQLHPECRVLFDTNEDLEIGNIQDGYFSPLKNFLVTYQNITKRITKNLKLWDLNGNVIKSWTVTNRLCWPIIQWTPDEQQAYFMPRKGTIEVYEGNNWEQPGNVATYAGLKQFSLGPGNNPKILLFFPEANVPGSVALYNANRLSQPIGRKTISKADSIIIHWNVTGSSVLVMTYMEVDTSGKLYSGRSGGLYLLREDGYECRVDIRDNPPIHDIRWNPNPERNEFCVVAGYIPKCDALLFDKDANKMSNLILQQPRNTIVYTPCGRIVAIGGFGNLQGYLNFYNISDPYSPILIGNTTAFSTTFHTFSPDSRYFLAATLSPRLRVDNGIKLLSYNGRPILDYDCEELYDVRFQPNPHVVYPEFNIERGTVTEEVSTVYRPPTRTERPSGGRGGGRGNPIGGTPVERTPIGGTPVGGQIKQGGRGKNKNKPNNNNNNNNNNNSNAPTSKPENRKRNLQNKLKEIKKLKERIDNGDTLNPMQLEKINNEEAVKREIEEIDKSLGINTN